MSCIMLLRLGLGLCLRLMIPAEYSSGGSNKTHFKVFNFYFIFFIFLLVADVLEFVS